MKRISAPRVKASFPLFYYKSEEAGGWRIRGANGLVVGEFASRKEAAYYCQAVNLHADIIEAARDAVRIGSTSGNMAAALDRLDKILAKTKEAPCR